MQTMHLRTCSNLRNIVVSVVIPVRNEERFISECLDSLLKQTYPKDQMEWIIVDGKSDDSTWEVLESYRSLNPELIILASNPQKTAPCAMNIGIDASRGKYIVRLDAHAEYPTDYIEKCVHYLETDDADNVGGLAITRGKTPLGETIAKMLSSPFGVGNSQFRIGGKSGYVDTVPFGAFKREVFETLGGYNERLVRNQDNEMNHRIRSNGGKIYLASDINFTYYCRDTLKGIIRMAFDNGKWNVLTSKIVPGTMGWRHFVPLVFVFSLVFLIIASFPLPAARLVLALELVAYILCDVYFSKKAASGIKDFFVLLGLHPLFHISYGLGSMVGLIKAPFFK